MFHARSVVAAALTLTCAAALTACGDGAPKGGNGSGGKAGQSAHSAMPSYNPDGDDANRDITGSNCRYSGTTATGYHRYKYDLTIKDPSDVAFRYRINYLIHPADSSSAEEYVVEAKQQRKVTVYEDVSATEESQSPKCEVGIALKVPASAPHPKSWY